MAITQPISKRSDEIAAQMPRREPVFHQVHHDVVEECGDDFVALTDVDPQSPSLIPEQRRIKQEELSDRGFISTVDGGEQSRGRRITGGGELVVFTPRSLVAPLHEILPSSVVFASASRETHTRALQLSPPDPAAQCPLDFFHPARRQSGLTDSLS